MQADCLDELGLGMPPAAVTHQGKCSLAEAAPWLPTGGPWSACAHRPYQGLSGLPGEWVGQCLAGREARGMGRPPPERKGPLTREAASGIEPL